MDSVTRLNFLHECEFLSEAKELLIIINVHQLDSYFFLTLDIFSQQDYTEGAASKQALYFISSFCQIFMWL